MTTIYGIMHVSDGGKADGVTVGYGGKLNVSAGGTVNTTTIASQGSMYVSDGGKADDVTVGHRAYLYVSSGGTATQILENGGCVNVDNGATVTFLPNSFGGYTYTFVSATIHSGNTGTNLSANEWGKIYVIGGTAENTSVGSSGYLYVSSGGVANGATVKAYGGLEIHDGGKLTGKMSFEGNAVVSAYEGSIIDFDISGVSPNNDPFVNNLSLVQGTPTYTLTVNGSEAAGNYKLAENAAGFNKTITVVNTSGVTLGTLTVDGGATKIGGRDYTLTLTDGGSLGVTVAGDVIADTTPPVVFNIKADITGPTNQNVTVTADFDDDVALASKQYRIGDGAWQDYPDGGVTVTQNGTVEFKATDTAGNETTASCEVTNIAGSPVYDLTGDLKSTVDLTTGMIAGGVNILDGGRLRVLNGGCASMTTINSKGIMDVSGGAEADGVTVKDGARLYVSDGTAYNVKENGGLVDILGRAVVTFLPNSFGGYSYEGWDWATIHSGTTGTDLTIGSGGIEVYYGGLASRITVNSSGYFYVFQGGSATDTTVSDGGILYVDGGVANGATVNANGNLEICDGGKVTGTMSFEDNAVVSAYEGSIIDFDISGVSPENDPFVNNLSLVQGTPTYTLTVTGIEAAGNYKLAENAAGFNKTITVVNTSGVTLGTLTVDGGATKIGGRDYTLTLTDGGSLGVTLGSLDRTPPVVSNVKADITAPTNRNVTVTAEFSDDLELASRLYKIGDGDWQDYPDSGVVVSGITQVSFKAVDTSGNESNVEGIFIDYIDKVAPVVTDITPSTTEPDAASVTVTATFSDNKGLASKQYRIGIGDWQDYPDGGVTVTENTTVYFRAVDTAGNETEANCEVTNIAGSPVYDLTGDVINLVRLRWGKVASGINIKSGGSLYVSEGAIASDMIVNSGGSLYIANGGTATNVKENGGYVGWNGYPSVTFVSNTIAGFAMDSGGGATVHSGTTLTAPVVNKGIIYVYSSGIASEMTVGDGGAAYIYTGGIAHNVKENGGYVRVYDDADVTFAANEITGLVVNSWRLATVHSGTTATAPLINCGSVFVYSSGIVNEATVNSGGSAFIYGGGVAHNIRENGGYVDIEDGADVTFVSNTISGLDLNNGQWTTVHSGTTATDITVSDSALFLVYQGGIAIDATVKNNGTFYIFSGAKLSGKATFEAGATVITYTGTIFDFDISGISPDNVELVNNLSMLRGNSPDFTLTVSGTQSTGVYNLAKGAAEFDHTITVKDTLGTDIGTLTPNSGFTKIGDLYYSLAAFGSGVWVTVADTPEITDTEKPVVTSVQADIADPTHNPVTVTATFTDNKGVAVAMYRLGDGDGIWKDYPVGGVVLKWNNTVFFKAVDAAGNESEVVSLDVTNIDPVGDAVFRDNHSFATAYDLGTDDSIKSANDAAILDQKEKDYYSFKLTKRADIVLETSGPDDSDTYLNLYGSEENRIATNNNYGDSYFSKISKTLDPGTYYVEVTNNGYQPIDNYSLTVTVTPAGNLSGDLTASYDLTAGMVGHDVNILNGGELNVSDGGTVENTTVNNGGELNVSSGGKLTGKMTFENGATVTAETGAVFDFDLTQTTPGADALVKNLSLVLDQPFTYTITVDNTQALGTYKLASGAEGFNKPVTLMSVYGENGGTYTVEAGTTKVGDAYITLALDGSDLTFTISEYNLQNKPDDGANDFLWTKKDGWNDANILVNNFITGDREINLDERGTIDKDGKHNMFGNDGTKKDTGDVAKIDVNTPAKLTFTIDSTAPGTFYVYEDGFDKKGNRKQITVAKVTVKKDQTATLKDVCLTATGSYYVAMTAKNVKKAGTEGLYNVNVTTDKFFADADDNDNNTPKDNFLELVYRDMRSIVMDGAPMFGSTTCTNFVGLGDSVDYIKLDLNSNAFLSFSLTGEGDGKAKFTVWKQAIGTTGKLSKVTSVSLPAKKQYAATTKAQFLDTSKYTYYVSMECTDAAKGKGVYYNVQVTDDSVFFDSADNGRNDVLYDKKGKAFYAEDADHHFETTSIGGGTKAVKLDSDPVEDTNYENFVGYGDPADYAKIELTTSGDLYFKLKATGNATFTVYEKTQDKKGNDMLKAVQTTKLTLAKGKTTVEATTDLIADLAAGEYYVSMTAKNTKANASGSVFYNVTANLNPSVASPLSMPEADSLGISDALSLGGYDVDVLADASASALADLDDKSGWQSLLA